MSHIDDLIAKLCPDGVEFKELQELFVTKNGYTPSTRNRAYWTGGTVPWFRMEDIRENGRILSSALQQVTDDAVKGGRLFPANSLIIATSATIGEHALITVPHLSNQRFTSLVLKSAFAERLDMAFAFYYCFVLGEWCRSNTTTSSFASVDMSGFRKFPFPVPPLEVQHEIVKVLDNFTALEAELEAELEARRRQYEHYRDALLTFDGDPRGTGRAGGRAQESHRVRWMTLGEVVEILDRYRKPVARERRRAGAYPYYGANGIQDYVDDFIFDGTYLLLGEDGSVVNTDGSPVINWASGKIWVNNHAHVLGENREMACLRFLFHYLQTIDITEWVRGTPPKLNQANLRVIPIPVPDVEEQARIVAILDKFDALVNDLSVGLPAELKARRQQYEHYRDRLLSFPEAA